MSPDKPKRRIVVRVTARDKSDPTALLAAVRNALTGHGLCIELRVVVPETPAAALQIPVAQVAPSATPPSVVSDEVLEKKARELAQAHLDAAAAAAEKKGAAVQRDAERMRAEIAAQQAGLRAYLAHWLGQGVRITVEIYEKSVGAVVGAISRALGGKGDKSD
jgi:hypothetical protein